MNRILSTCAFALAGLALAPAAQASVYSDDLDRCVVRQTSTEDKAAMIRWIFSALSGNPSLKSMVNVTDRELAESDVKMAATVERLLLADCRKEAVQAVKYDGPHAIETSFGLLGQIAMRELMAEENTARQVGKFAEHLDEDKWAAFNAEAGIPKASAAAPAKSR
ncbi:hypothetical protein G432_16770 [Sphingomonas sp. MM-1]|uniref:hypothetical protein n=1 Tax=Sphingomonas sp. MM-1 TaxID=745310 RepID=UPI0002C1099B|nr:MULTISPECIES: hypothetical protein [unclassified Sphingomonas]AGH51072.1 hypothetical protein G432_16770 [Sphingomonas sp. MM-1]MDX3886045.1 hypothetical protein [Sphingomonas sp.]